MSFGYDLSIGNCSNLDMNIDECDANLDIDPMRDIRIILGTNEKNWMGMPGFPWYKYQKRLLNPLLLQDLKFDIRQTIKKHLGISVDVNFEYDDTSRLLVLVSYDEDDIIIDQFGNIL